MKKLLNLCAQSMRAHLFSLTIKQQEEDLIGQVQSVIDNINKRRYPALLLANDNIEKIIAVEYIENGSPRKIGMDID